MDFWRSRYLRSRRCGLRYHQPPLRPSSQDGKVNSQGIMVLEHVARWDNPIKSNFSNPLTRRDSPAGNGEISSDLIEGMSKVILVKRNAMRGSMNCIELNERSGDRIHVFSTIHGRSWTLSDFELLEWWRVLRARPVSFS